MLDEKAQKEVEAADNNKMTIKDYIKWGFICIAVGLAFLAVGVWMFSDGSTFLGLLEIVGSIAAFVFSFVMFKNAAIKIKEEITDNQKRKLKVFLGVCVSGVFALAVCVFAFTRTASDKQINDFLYRLDSEYYDAHSSENLRTLKKCIRSENFALLVDSYVEQLFSEEEYEEITYLVSNLNESGYVESHLTDGLNQLILNAVKTSVLEENAENGFAIVKEFSTYRYHSEDLKISLSEEINTLRNNALENNDSKRIMDFIELVKACLDGNYYTSIIECFPYQEMRTYFETHGIKLITKTGENGYYDAIQDEFVNESYWYSPLDGKKVSRGDIGRYKYTKEYSFYGDFMMESVSKVWYEAGPNEYDSYLYFKGDMILNDYGGSPFTMICIFEMTDHVYVLEAEDDLMIVALEEGTITLVHNFEMVSIAYE